MLKKLWLILKILFREWERSAARREHIPQTYIDEYYPEIYKMNDNESIFPEPLFEQGEVIMSDAEILASQQMKQLLNGGKKFQKQVKFNSYSKDEFMKQCKKLPKPYIWNS